MVELKESRAVPCPGPRPYGEEHAGVFFGRDREITMLLERARVQGLSVLDAASASGKTSLLQAGLLPALRESRLAQIAEGAAASSAFPLLLNQWLGRRGAGAPVDYARVVIVEADRSLRASRRWYEARVGDPDPALGEAARSELRVIDATRQRLRSVAAEDGLVTLESAGNQSPDAELRPTTPASRVTDRVLVQGLMRVLRELTKALGDVLLILDQFEEVLGDPALGRQAVAAVEAVFLLRRGDVRQLLSLRNDALYLLDPLERKGILESKRRVSLVRFDPGEVRKIVAQMSDCAKLTWDDGLLERVVDAFTAFPGDGAPGRDVNLLGLQVVLRGLFETVPGIDPARIDLGGLRAYASRLAAAGPGIAAEAMSAWLARRLRDARHDDLVDPIDRLLAEDASRDWIDRCLEARAADATGGGGATPPNEPHEPEIRPMVARMADWLVTPAGFKRPMTLGELETVAFRRDQVDAKPKMAGRAKRDRWAAGDRERVLDGTCV